MQLFKTPVIDNVFDGLDENESRVLALALLRRHAVISEDDGSYIAYHFARDAAADLIISTMHTAFKSEDLTPAQNNEFICNMYNKTDEFIYNEILSNSLHKRIIPISTPLVAADLPLLEIPGFTVLDGIIMPETQVEWASKNTFQFVNLDKQIVDAIYYDQNIIFIVGEPTGDPVLIGDILQNEIINVMFADRKFNMLSANTYRLG